MSRPFDACKAWSRHVHMEELGPTPPAGRQNPPLGTYGIPTWFRCTRCGVERVVVVSGLTGSMMTSRYFNYPPGYRHLGGNAPSKAELRLDYLNKRGRPTLRSVGG